MDVEASGQPDHPIRHTPRLSRRRLLHLGGVTAMAATASQLLGSGIAWADTYDGMRATWVLLLTGSGFDSSATPFSTALSTLGSQATSFQNSMAPTATGTPSLWPDLPIGTVSANVTSSYLRLKTMALAYVQPGTGLTGSAALASDISTGLDWMYANAYTPTLTTYNNWWDWQIGSPQPLLDTCALMYSHLTSAQIANYCSAVDHFVPTSAVSSYSGSSTGANRLDLCRVLAVRGVVGKNSSRISTAQQAISPVLPVVRSGDGYYADGSYIQHTSVPYAGTYGDVLLDGFGKLLALLAGTTWAVTDPKLQNLYTAVDACWAPFVYNGLVMDGVSGRAVSRGVSNKDPLQALQTDHTRGHSVIAHILQLANSGAPSTAQAAQWKALAKGWMQRDYYASYLSDPTLDIPSLARAQTLLNDAGVTASAEAVGSYVFGMDRAVHRRTHWAAQISMCSARTSFYETINNENLRGWHQNSGLLYWYGDTYGDGQYSDEFWPTVDPYMLPGTTVSTLALADAVGGAPSGTPPTNTFAGGASDGTYSVVGQDVRGVQSTLTGKKSWFCLDDSVFCLGAGITCTDGTGVQTTVDNRNLGAGNGQSFTVDGTVQSSTLGWSNTFSNPGYMAISTMGAWVFPSGGTVKAKRAARTGAWSDINGGSSTASVTRDYLSMWFDHGTNPSGATYCYQLMPGATAAQAAARVASPNVTVLENTATIQAVSVPSLGLTMANFFAAGTAGPVTVTAPCSVLVKEDSSTGTMTVAVSDPTRASNTVQVTIARSTYASVTATAGIQVLTTSGTVVLLAEVGGTLGTSLTATLSTSGTAPKAATASSLTPTASTYVRDGSSADTNFSGQTTMTVKNSNSTTSGTNRRALLKFDVSSVPGTVKRAVLWTYGNVQDSGGTLTTLQAFGLSSDTWTESGVTWNTAPSLTTAMGTGQVSTTKDWVGLDVTTAVAAAQSAGGGDGTAALAVFEPLGAAGLATVLNTRTNSVKPPRLEVVSS